MRKITLRVQEPDSSPREVSIRSRIDPKQKFVPGAMLPVAIDPKDPKRVYPASPESAKRAIVTGSRQQRRIMQARSSAPRAAAPANDRHRDISHQSQSCDRNPE